MRTSGFFVPAITSAMNSRQDMKPIRPALRRRFEQLADEVELQEETKSDQGVHMTNPGPPPFSPGDNNPYGAPQQPGDGNPYTGSYGQAEPGSFNTGGVQQPYSPHPPNAQPGGPSGSPMQPRSPGSSKGRTAAIAIAALSVLVIGLGVALGVQLGKKPEAAAVAPPTTVTQTVDGTAATVTVSGSGTGGASTVTATETVTRTSTASAAPGTSAENTSGSADPTDSTGADAPIVGKVGTPLALSWKDYSKTGKGSLTFNSVKRAASFGTDYSKQTAKNGAYVAVDVTYTVTSGTVDYDSYDWHVKDADGREYNSTSVYDSGMSLLKHGTLAAGDKVRGVIVFDAPKGALKLTYTIAGDLGASWPLAA